MIYLNAYTSAKFPIQIAGIIYTIKGEAVSKTYPPSKVEILGSVTIPIIFFHPFKFIAAVIKAVFTIVPTIN